MKKDLGKNNGRPGTTCSAPKLLHQEKRMLRADWSESSKAIAKDGDDHLILGEFSNLEDENLEW